MLRKNEISDRALTLVAVIASWVFGLSGADALGPALIALLMACDKVLKSSEASPDSMRLAVSMCYQLFTIFAVYFSGAVMRAFT